MRIETSVLALVTATLAFLPTYQGDRDAATTTDVPEAVRQQLQLILAGNIPTGELNVVYNDMHSFHGGKTLSVNGDTLRAQYLLREDTGRRHVDSSPVAATTDQLQALVSLLLEIEAWEQRVPEREPVPDESRTGLSIRIGAVESRIWEWYNDLSENDRIGRVKRLLEEIAGPIPDQSTGHDD